MLARRGRLVLFLALGVASGVCVACSSGYTTDPAQATDTDASVPSQPDASVGMNADASSAAADASPLSEDSGMQDADASPCTAGQSFASDPMNCGACKHVCNAGSDCVAAECKRVVFVTAGASGGGGDLGGLAGADTICQTAATKAGLHNTFFAWLGVANMAPANRYTKSTRPYVLPDGTQVSASFTTLTAGMGLDHGINVDADGTVTALTRAWTNVNGNGTAVVGANDGCVSWTSNLATDRANYGNVGGSGQGWTASSSDACLGGSHGLYCFEQ